MTSLWHHQVSSPGCQDHWSPGSAVLWSAVCWQQRALHLAESERKGMRENGIFCNLKYGKKQLLLIVMILAAVQSMSKETSTKLASDLSKWLWKLTVTVTKP